MFTIVRIPLIYRFPLLVIPIAARFSQISSEDYVQSQFFRVKCKTVTLWTTGPDHKSDQKIFQQIFNTTCTV